MPLLVSLGGGENVRVLGDTGHPLTVHGDAYCCRPAPESRSRECRSGARASQILPFGCSARRTPRRLRDGGPEAPGAGKPLALTTQWVRV